MIQPQRRTTKREDESSCIWYLSCYETDHGWVAIIASISSYWLAESGHRPIRLVYRYSEKASHGTTQGSYWLAIEYATTQGSHWLAYRGSHPIGFSTADEKASNGTQWAWTYCLAFRGSHPIGFHTADEEANNRTTPGSYWLAHRERRPVGFHTTWWES